MVKKFHNGTNIIAKHDPIFLEEEIIEFSWHQRGKHTLALWRKRFQALT
jgi:hypothetical protein